MCRSTVPYQVSSRARRARTRSVQRAPHACWPQPHSQTPGTPHTAAAVQCGTERYSTMQHRAVQRGKESARHGVTQYTAVRGRSGAVQRSCGSKRMSRVCRDERGDQMTELLLIHSSQSQRHGEGTTLEEARLWMDGHRQTRYLPGTHTTLFTSAHQPVQAHAPRHIRKCHTSRTHITLMRTQQGTHAPTCSRVLLSVARGMVFTVV